jgi:hypothetical protein
MYRITSAYCFPQAIYVIEAYAGENAAFPMSLQYHRCLERKVKSEGNSTTVTNNVQPTEVVSG